jgi:hypothetical protein
MIDSPDTLSRYLRYQLERGFRHILAEQSAIAGERVYGHSAFRSDGSPRGRSGRLAKALSSPTAAFSGSGASLSARIDYPTYIRFLDMKRKGNYKIYNRPVWGILYRETFQNIRYEFRDWVRNNAVSGLQSALTDGR